MAPNLGLKYSQYSGEDTASIKIVDIDDSSNRTKCKIKGVWIQDGGEWNFSGELDKRKV